MNALSPQIGGSSPEENTPVRKAVLLAAGRGKRLAPHTDLVPKPMLELAGSPLIEYILHHLRGAGIAEVLMVTGHLGEQIRARFGDGRDLGLHLHYLEQAPPPGTGGAALQAESFVAGDSFFLGWGDVLCARHDYQRLMAAFQRRRVDALVMLEYVEDPTTGAAIYLDGERITSLVEKPPPGSSATHWNQAGLTLLTPAIFPCLHQLRPSPRGEIEFTGALQLLVDRSAEVFGLPMEAPRLHLTRPEDIYTVDKALREDPRYHVAPEEVA